MTSPPVDVIDEFRASLNDAAATFGIALSALPIVKRELIQFAQATNMKAAELVHLTTAGAAPEDGPHDAFAAWPLAHIPGALGPEGAIAHQAGHQWVVHVYHLWEGRYRGEIAAARGLNNMNELQNPHMGDLAKIRHDILKHRGIASRKNAAKCVHLEWFREGDDILIRDWMVYQFMEAFGAVYPVSGEVDRSKVLYRFHGLVESPIKLAALQDSDDTLVGTVKSLSGRPIDLSTLRSIFCGARFTLVGPGGQGTALGVGVHPGLEDEKTATVVAQAPRDFVQRVRVGEATAHLPLGSAIPHKETRRAVLVKWLRDDTVIAEAVAPEGRWYDDVPYRRQIGEWLPLVSEIGDLYEGVLTNVAHYPRDRRRLELQLRVSADLADKVKEGVCTLRLPLDLGRP